jgi:hypothetical protein
MDFEWKTLVSYSQPNPKSLVQKNIGFIQRYQRAHLHQYTF